MNEIGGYIELDHYTLPMLHADAIALNCGRNALAYLIEAKRIKKMLMPYFMCDSCENVFKKYNVSVRYYRIDSKFQPVNINLQQDEWFYIVNYYGQFSNERLTDFREAYKRIIVDNAQSYFQMPIDGVDTLYTCRKYFGVADGAFLYTDTQIQRELLFDESHNRMHFLLGRYERSATEFYREYIANNNYFNNEPIKQMSILTNNLLHGIDYKLIAEKRKSNFEKLHINFAKINKLDLKVSYGAFMYPLLVNNGAAIRKVLQKEKIYIPVLWPNVLNTCKEDTWEFRYAENIMPLPVDQRYDAMNMEYMSEVIKKCIG